MESLVQVAKGLVAKGKGILAADESTGTIGKRLEKVGLENVEENRQGYREVWLDTPGLEMFISGIYPGIKVDEGLEPLEGGLPGETHTKGLENLAESCKGYVAAGAKFAKWRATIKVQGEACPSELALKTNADELAQYAKICQAAGLVPIVEPEILIDGDHSPQRFQEVTEKVISECVSAMWKHSVLLEGVLLKPQMVFQGADFSGAKATPAEIALHTITAMKRTLPAAVPGIVFLSGGQTEEEATINLNAINLLAQQADSGCPWALTFSFGRALQHSVLKLWAADKSKVNEARALALAVAQANSQASMGQYTGPHPSTDEGSSLREGFRGWRQ
eukprot:gene16275-22455_t